MNCLHDFSAIAFVFVQMRVVLVVWTASPPHANHDFLFLISCMVDYYPHYLLNEVVAQAFG